MSEEQRESLKAIASELQKLGIPSFVQERGGVEELVFIESSEDVGTKIALQIRREPFAQLAAFHFLAIHRGSRSIKPNENVWFEVKVALEPKACPNT